MKTGWALTRAQSISGSPQGPPGSASGRPVDHRFARCRQQPGGARVREQPFDCVSPVSRQLGRVRVRVKVEVFVDERRFLQGFFAPLLGGQLRDHRAPVSQPPGDARPQHLRDAFDAEPAAMLRLLESWIYVNDETVTDLPNTREFLRGSKQRRIAPNHDV